MLAAIREWLPQNLAAMRTSISRSMALKRCLSEIFFPDFLPSENLRPFLAANASPEAEKTPPEAEGTPPEAEETHPEAEETPPEAEGTSPTAAVAARCMRASCALMAVGSRTIMCMLRFRGRPGRAALRTSGPLYLSGPS